MASNQSGMSYGAYASGDMHQFTRYMGPSGVSLHPLQRNGAVPSSSHDHMARWGGGGPAGIGAGYYPASQIDMTLPPVVPIAGNPRDPNFMVA